MRQPKFLRHIVEKFLLKGQEANANLYPGILNVWDLQPIGVTRLPISVMKIDAYLSNAPHDLSGALNAPTVWTQTEGETLNTTTNIGTGIPAGTIIQFDSLVTASLVPTAAVFFAMRLTVPGGGALVFSVEGNFGIGQTGPMNFNSPFMIFGQDLDLSITVLTINPASQVITFSTTICLFPNRE